MATIEQAAGRTGAVRLGDRVLTVGVLPQAEEARLFDRLRAALKAEQGDYLRANRAMVEAADPRDRPVIVETLVRMEAGREPLSVRAVMDYRRTPKGCAIELHARARKYHPDLTAAEVEAVVTEANCVELAEQLADAVAGADPKGNG